MIIIIDAYNYIKQILQVSFAHEQTINNIVQQFLEYATVRENEIILVFDAGPYQQVTSDQVHSLVTVSYSGAYLSADDVIKDMIDEKKSQDILIVSSDREICAYAQAHNIVSIGSLEFDRVFHAVMKVRVKADKKIKGTITKTTSGDTPELDTLMELASRNLVQKDKQYAVQTQNILQTLYSAHTLSKIDKKLLKKISKI